MLRVPGFFMSRLRECFQEISRLLKNYFLASGYRGFSFIKRLKPEFLLPDSGWDYCIFKLLLLYADIKVDQSQPNLNQLIDAFVALIKAMLARTKNRMHFILASSVHLNALMLIRSLPRSGNYRSISTKHCKCIGILLISTNQIHFQNKKRNFSEIG